MNSTIIFIFRKLKDFKVKAAGVTLLSNRVLTLDPSTLFNDIFGVATSNGAKLQEAEMLIEKLRQENYHQKLEVWV